MKTPDVYIRDVKSTPVPQSFSSTVGALIGVTRAGKIGEAIKIGSWTEFINKFANGLDTPFLANHYLPYAVYGFFANGGKELYVVSVKKNAVKATKTTPLNAITATAKSEGVWGNQITIEVKKSKGHVDTTNEIFNVTVKNGEKESVVVAEVTLATIAEQVMANPVIENWLSEFSVATSTQKLKEETATLTSGTDGDSLQDADYISALSALDVCDDLTFVAVTGQTSQAVNEAVLTYADNHQLFPILDVPVGTTPENAIKERKKYSAWAGAMTYPWGKVQDPLTNKLKLVPLSAHLMGMMIRVISSQGVHKAPAGVDAVIRGVVELEKRLTNTELGDLNMAGVMCVVSRPNSGIVSWGARGLNTKDDTMKYVTDGLLNLAIKKSLYNATQFAIFEPNNDDTWSRVRGACKSILESFRAQGSLKGTQADAYYVIVDETNNTPEDIGAGIMNIMVGYAPTKPAEFIIINLSHNMQS